MIMFNLGQFPKDCLSGETVFRNTNNEQRRIHSLAKVTSAWLTADLNTDVISKNQLYIFRPQVFFLKIKHISSMLTGYQKMDNTL